MTLKSPPSDVPFYLPGFQTPSPVPKHPLPLPPSFIPHPPSLIPPSPSLTPISFPHPYPPSPFASPIPLTLPPSSPIPPFLSPSSFLSTSFFFLALQLPTTLQAVYGFLGDLGDHQLLFQLPGCLEVSRGSGLGGITRVHSLGLRRAGLYGMGSNWTICLVYGLYAGVISFHIGGFPYPPVLYPGFLSELPYTYKEAYTCGLVYCCYRDSDILTYFHWTHCPRSASIYWFRVMGFELRVLWLVHQNCIHVIYFYF